MTFPTLPVGFGIIILRRMPQHKNDGGNERLPPSMLFFRFSILNGVLSESSAFRLSRDDADRYVILFSRTQSLYRLRLNFKTIIFTVFEYTLLNYVMRREHIRVRSNSLSVFEKCRRFRKIFDFFRNLRRRKCTEPYSQEYP